MLSSTHTHTHSITTHTMNSSPVPRDTSVSLDKPIPRKQKPKKKKKVPKKFARRSRTGSKPDLTYFIDDAQCKNKSGPHGRGMEFIANSIPPISDLDIESLQRSKRWKKNRGKDAPNKRRQVVDPIHLPLKQDVPPGFFYRFDYGDDESRRYADSLCSSIPPELIVDCNNFTVYDNFKGSRKESVDNMILLSEEGTFIAAKLSPRQASAFLGGETKIRQFYKDLLEASDVRPDIKRGPTREGISEAYTGFGYKADRCTGELRGYAFKPGVDEIVKNRVDQALCDLSFAVERGARALDNPLAESRVMASFKSVTGLPSCSEPAPNSEDRPEEIRMYSTALSIGFDYWSLSHEDKDLYFTALTANGPDSLDINLIVQNFVFPKRESLVPLRSGEVMLFNPYEQHGSTNARSSGSFLVSNHNARKTARTAAALALKNFKA